MLRLTNLGVATAYVTVSPEERQRERLLLVSSFGDLRVSERSALHGLGDTELLFLFGRPNLACSIRTTDLRQILRLSYPNLESAATSVAWTFAIPYDLGEERQTTEPGGGAGLSCRIYLRLWRTVYADTKAHEAIVRHLAELARRYLTGRREILADFGWSDFVIDGGLADAGNITAFIDLLAAVRSLRGSVAGKSLPLWSEVRGVLGADPDVPQRPTIPLQTEVIAALADIGLDVKWKSFNTAVVQTARMLPSDTGEDAGHVVVSYEMPLWKDCSCAHDTLGMQSALDAALTSMNVVLTAAQVQAINNVRVLLSSTMRDRSLCCDVRRAVRACIETLHTILSEEPNARPQAGDTRRREARLRGLHRTIEQWCWFVEVLLRQRTASLDGNRSLLVQQFAYLADCLINDFARRVDPAAPFFATVFDPVNSAVSVTGTGLVRIPVVYAFMLPLAISDLWHEVGVAVYFKRYSPPEGSADSDRSDLIVDRANLYADLVVYLYGFGGDYARFVAALYAGWRSATASESQAEVLTFLRRAYFVFELDRLRLALRSGDARAALQFLEPGIAASLVRELEDVLASSDAVAMRDRGELHVPRESWAVLLREITGEEFSRWFRSLYAPFATMSIDVARPSLSSFEGGEIQALPPDADLNSYYGELFAALHRRPSSEWSTFAVTGAVACSVIAEYRRRDASQIIDDVFGSPDAAAMPPREEVPPVRRRVGAASTPRKPPLRVFLCHARVDIERVRPLFALMTELGVDVWLDEERLLPGEEWAHEITLALRDTHVVLVCLSQAALGQPGYIHKEIKAALDIADQQPEGSIFMIPAKLETCEIPERLSRWHWLDLTTARWKSDLTRSLTKCAQAKGLSIEG